MATGVTMYQEAIIIYKAISTLLMPQREWMHFDQLARSAASIVANIAEAGGKKRFVDIYGRQHQTYFTGGIAYPLVVARGELWETRGWLDIGIQDGVFEAKDTLNIIVKLNILSDALFDVYKAAPPIRSDLPTTDFFDEEEKFWDITS